MKVLVTGRLPDIVYDQLASVHDVQINREDRPMDRTELLARITDQKGLLSMITDAVDRELLERAPHLMVVANHAVGYNNIDLQAATQRGILVTNTPGVLTDATAEVALVLMLAVARRVVEGDRRTREGQFKFWAPLHFLGSEVSGKTLGIIGLGRIGRAVAMRARGFRMRVLYHNPRRLEKDTEAELAVSYVSLPELLAQADFVSLHVPLTPDTRHLIGAAELAQMKPTAFLINTSRGEVVDEAALLAALESGTIAGAGLDVYENEPQLTPGLTALDNAVLLPHVGSATIETRTRMAQKAADNLLAGLEGRRPPDCLNWDAIHANR